MPFIGRYDGDDPLNRESLLLQFKAVQNEKGAALLITTKSGGVGLNIPQANHCLFVDR
jgi:hypothetical protein